MDAILLQGERRVPDALEMGIPHADVVHVVQCIADVVDAGPARAEALRHQARAAVQVELADVGRVGRVGDEREGANDAAGVEPHRDQARLVHAAQHLALPQARQRALQARRDDAVGHAPA